MKKYSLIISLIMLVFSLGPQAHCLEPRTLSGEEEYYQGMAGLFTQAKESIDIVIDEIVIDPLDPKGLVSKIIESLLEARKTGVRVRVVLEDTTSPRNFTAYRTLLEGGIDVYFDTSRLLVNSRAVVVDSATCVIGGLSWAPDSWRDDHTLSVVIDSEEMAGTVEGSISKLLLTEAAPLMEIEAEGMLIPNDFLLLKKFGMRFIDGRAEEAFDLYLLIIKEAQEKSSSELLFDHEGWGRTLSLEKKFFREFESDQERSQYYNSRLKKALGVLDGRYGLVDYDEEDRRVTLLEQFNIDLACPDATSPCFVLPDKFWDAELRGSLDLSAKYLYLISLLEAKKSMRSPYWFSNEEMLAGLYSLNPDTVSSGLHKLEEMNLVEIARAPIITAESSEKERNVYRINKVLTWGEFNEKIAEFEQGYGKEITRQAEKEASELNEPRDLYIIKTFIGLIQKYGYPAVRRANADTLSYERGSSLRHIFTTIKALERE